MPERSFAQAYTLLKLHVCLTSVSVMTILTIAGSPTRRSRSSALLRYAANRLAAKGFEIAEAGLYDIPAIELIDPTAYTGLCADMARDAAKRVRARKNRCVARYCRRCMNTRGTRCTAGS
jgi:multimeric flavodoxin WrbA